MGQNGGCAGLTEYPWSSSEAAWMGARDARDALAGRGRNRYTHCNGVFQLTPRQSIAVHHVPRIGS
jgi:hypothetical protein